MRNRWNQKNVQAVIIAVIIAALFCANLEEISVYASKQGALIRTAYQPLGKIKQNRYQLTEDGYYRNRTIQEQLKLADKREKEKETVYPFHSVEEEARTATIMLVGDLMCLRAQQNSAKTKSTYNFNASFSHVKEIFSKGDLVVGNLETLTSHSNYYTFEQKLIGGSPNCNAPATYLDALRYAGFDAVTTANNHCLDGGKNGIKETMEKLEEYQIAHTGTYQESTKQRFLLYEVNGIKIGILSYTEYINFRESLPGNELNASVNCYSKKAVERDVAEAKKAGAEFIIAYNHWGTENTTVLTKNQKAHAKEMAEAGVDVIIGSHPHCLQEADYLTTSDGRNVLCMYSMGNFVSSMVSQANNDTIILRLELRKEEGKVFLHQSGYYPLKVFPVYEQKRYVIVPTKEEEFQKKVGKEFTQARKRIQSVLGSKLPEWSEEK